MSRSITPAPSGSLSPDFITVPSSTGFSAGDYVYQKNGDFGVPASSGAANFDVTPISSVYGGTVGGTSTPVNYRGPSGTVSGGSSGECAAKLSDGNIVIVYRDSVTNYPSFRIVDTDNVQVVAPVVITASTSVLVARAPIGVIALTGGGFVTHFIDASGSSDPGIAVYTNTGTVTTAYAVDSTFPTTANTVWPIYGCALPNGGFALTIQGSGLSNTYLRAYDATGVGAYAWANAGTINGSVSSIGIAARSDSSVCIAWNVSATVLNYAVYNSSGGAVVAATAISVAAGGRSVGVACLTNNTFVIGYLNDSSGPFQFRLLPTGNVLSSAFTVPTTNVKPPNNVQSLITLEALSSGGFVYFMVNGGTGGNGLSYIFYTAAGVAVHPTVKQLPQIIYDYPSDKFGIVEISGYLSLYHAGTLSTTPGTLLFEMYNSKISLTTYELLTTPGVTSSVGTVSSGSGAYARSTSLPMKAAYLAANTETVALNQTISTGNVYTVAPSAVDSNAVDSVKSTTLPDGRFAIVYKNASTGAVSFNVYSVTGVLQTTVSVGTGGTGLASRVRIAALSSGKIAVGYFNAAGSILSVALYSSTFSLINTATVSVGSTLGMDLAGLTNDRFVLAYLNLANSYVSYIVYDNTATLVQGTTPSSDATIQTLSVQASSNGGFWLAWVTNSTNARSVYYYQNSTNSYTAYYGPFSYGSGVGNTVMPCQVAVNSSGIAAFLSAAATTTCQIYTGSFNGGAANIISSGNITAFNTGSWTNGNGAVGATGAGTFLFFGSGNTNGNLYGFTGASSVNNATAYPYGLLSGITVSATYGMQACITPSYGYNAVIAWINSANIAQYAIVNAYPFGATQAITAGVTGSAPTTPLNISQSSSYFLAGVAVSDCPPGGTGQIQTNGVANLNSQYSASTAFQGFDFQNPVTVGVKGTAVGRTVTMIKD
jgi:hypothetical protein